jgi:hypothetical protein
MTAFFEVLILLHFIHWALSPNHFTFSTHTTFVEVSLLWHSVHRFFFDVIVVPLSAQTACAAVL